MASPPTIRVAVTQAEPEWLDLAGTVKKTVELIGEASAGGAKLVAFPETWIVGYPGWIWSRPVDPPLGTRYILNSMAVDSPEMGEICAAAKKHSIAVVVGFSERSPSNSVYMSQAIISPQGDVLLHRRKIKPTHMERTVFGDGSGDDLTNVVEVDFGPGIGSVRVGTLNCWEHTQPLLKYHTYSQREAIHVSMWPPIDPHGGPTAPGLWSMSAEGCMGLSQTYAVEGGAYVLHCTAVCGQRGIDAMATKPGLLFQEPGGGHSAVVGPDGRRLTAPLEGGPASEGIVYADLDLTALITNRGFVDVVGHYSRPDLLWLGADRKQKEAVTASGSTKTVVVRGAEEE